MISYSRANALAFVAALFAMFGAVHCVTAQAPAQKVARVRKVATPTENAESQKKAAGFQAAQALLKVFAPALANPAPRPRPEAPLKVLPAIGVRPQPVSFTKLEQVTEQAVKELEKSVANDEAAKRQVKTLESQFRRIGWEELRFMHEVCHLTLSQFQAVRKQTKLACRACALEAAQYQSAMQNGFRGRPPQPSTPFRLIQNTMLSAAKDVLPPDVAAPYIAEMEERLAFRKIADAEMIISSLDVDLKLSDKQRRQMVRPIAEAWSSDWQQYIQILQHNGNQFLPPLPKEEIRKLLTLEQMRSLSSMNQSGPVFFGLQLNDLPPAAEEGIDIEDQLEFAPEADSP